MDECDVMTCLHSAHTALNYLLPIMTKLLSIILSVYTLKRNVLLWHAFTGYSIVPQNDMHGLNLCQIHKVAQFSMGSKTAIFVTGRL